MFERFTEQARQVVVLAQEEARLLRHHYIGTEHLLLGLLRDGDGVAAAALRSLGITLEQIRDEVIRVTGMGEEPVPDQVPFTPRAKKVLELSLRESLSLGHNYIGSEHILLGLASENEGVASRVLLEHGADAESVRNAVIRALSGSLRPVPGMVVGSAWRGMPMEMAWFAEIAPLLQRLGTEIRRELHREPDLGDVLLTLACAGDSLAGRAFTALGVDLDKLWGTIEQLRVEALKAQRDTEARIEEVSRAKEQAIEAQDFARAAELRDEERDLRARARELTSIQVEDTLDAIRRRLGIPPPNA